MSWVILNNQSVKYLVKGRPGERRVVKVKKKE
jgi:hypothetical protein